MSEKNTPEFNHYHHNAPEYTEEVLWHRVYAVAAAILIVVALSGWGLYSLLQNDEDSGSFKVETLAPSAAIPAETTYVEAVDKRTVVDTVAGAESEFTATPKLSAPPRKTTIINESDFEVSESKDTAAKEDDVKVDSTDTITAVEPAIPSTPVENHDYNVTLSILHKDITHAALTQHMNGLEPVKEINSTADLGDGFLKLYFYTDLNGRAGDTLTYSWYRNDKRVARVRVPVGSDRWRSHASKNISANMRGDWKVVVTDRKGNTLATSEFHLKQNAS